MQGLPVSLTWVCQTGSCLLMNLINPEVLGHQAGWLCRLSIRTRPLTSGLDLRVVSLGPKLGVEPQNKTKTKPDPIHLVIYFID